MKTSIAAIVCILGIVAAALAAQSNTAPFERGRSVCVPYDPAGLLLSQETNGDWRLQRADGAIFRVFASREDAEAGLAVAKAHTRLCYIGKSNTRPNRSLYVMEYWE
jgi:hypothetical protein